MRIWTINKIAAHFKEEDPNTTINPTCIRRLVKTGAIPATMIGRRYLVKLEDVEAYFNGQRFAPVEQPEPTAGTIRPVPERPTR